MCYTFSRDIFSLKCRKIFRRNPALRSSLGCCYSYRPEKWPMCVRSYSSLHAIEIPDRKFWNKLTLQFLFSLFFFLIHVWIFIWIKSIVLFEEQRTTRVSKKVSTIYKTEFYKYKLDLCSLRIHQIPLALSFFATTKMKSATVKGLISHPLIRKCNNVSRQKYIFSSHV